MEKELTYEQAMQRLEMATRLRDAQELMKYCHEKLYEAEKNCKSLLNIEEKE